MESLALCDSCPVEKSPNGLCFEGNWTQDEHGAWSFTGLWRCIYYDKNSNQCNS